MSKTVATDRKMPFFIPNFVRKIYPFILMSTYKIRKGLDLHLQGEAKSDLQTAPLGASYAVKPTDFTGIVPRPVVKEGETVKAGDALFVDKATEKIKFVSPVSGVVAGIDRGDRRKILRIRVNADKQVSYKNFGKVDTDALDAASAKQLLLDSGLFAFMRQRPYDVIASPEDSPKGIFVSTFSKMPLGADFSFVVKGQEAEFKTGLALLSKISKVFLGAASEQEGEAFLNTNQAEVNFFDGPNPAGNVSVQINHISPINKGEVAWTIAPEMVIAIGRLVLTGEVHLNRRIAVAGSEMKDPAYIETLVGAPLYELLKSRLQNTEHVRIINGNPFVGYKSSLEDYLGAFSTEICAIPEGDNVNEAFGWIAPRLKDYSTSHSYFSWLFGKSRRYNLDCRIKGGERHMIMSSEYERVFPMDIYPSYLVQAIITGDIDRQEALGIYEVAPEDFAVAEFIDSSKLELQRIVREGLDILRKENA